MDTEEVGVAGPVRRSAGRRDLRAAIVAAAREILEETGSDDAMSLRAIARRVGVTAPAIYGHFADRTEIVRTVVEAAFGELADAMRTAASTAVAAGADPADRLLAVCRAYLDFATEHPHHYRVLFERHRAGGPPPGEGAAPGADVRTMVGADAFGVLLDAVRACAEVRGPDADDAVVTTDRVWIGLHGQATLAASLPWHPWPDRETLVVGIVRRLADLP